ncbi:hypothetical protein [[Enterobacter] lignolyticus]|uniref:Phage tail tape measure protein, TP901 family n=1 Tax=[Enterobacter] lignolyticus TaxID=1334193 RepID=A0A806X7D8_9ENTR|nr:hypothetical protein [[Enterobacter] lignolyticus]ALR77768.1 hypothetical protein AO703_16205 [[Enterobacter] lignolyticus]
MSNSNPIQMLLSAVGRAKQPFKSLSAAGSPLSEEIAATQRQLEALNRSVSRIEAFRTTQEQLMLTGQQLINARIETQNLAIAFKKLEQPTHIQAQAFSAARGSVNALTERQIRLRLALQHHRQALTHAGINTQNLAGDEQQLQGNIRQTTHHLTQQQAQEKANTRQQKLAQIKQRFHSTQAIAGNVKAVGMGGIRGASTMVKGAMTLLKPGYQAAEQSAAAGNPLQAAQSAGAGSLGSDIDKLNAAWQTLSTNLFVQQESSLRKLVQTATEYLQKLDSWGQKNGNLVQTLGTIALVATGVMGVVGAIGYVASPVVSGINMIISAAQLLGPLFEGLSFTVAGLSLPAAAVVAALVGAALLIRKYWEPLSAFFSGVFEPLRPEFDWLGEVLQQAWQWFNNLITPIKASQQTLDSCRNAGTIFGQALADALMLPLNMFNKLRASFSWLNQSVNWVSQQLGWGNSSAGDSAPSPEETHTLTAGGDIQRQSHLAYQPVVAGANRTFTDNSTRNVYVTVQGDRAAGAQIGQQVAGYLDDHTYRSPSAFIY